MNPISSYHENHQLLDETLLHQTSQFLPTYKHSKSHQSSNFIKTNNKTTKKNEN